MKLSVAFLSLALSLGLTVEAGVAHKHHARHFHEHVKRDMETEVVTVKVYKTVYVNPDGQPWVTDVPPVSVESEPPLVKSTKTSTIVHTSTSTYEVSATSETSSSEAPSSSSEAPSSSSEASSSSKSKKTTTTSTTDSTPPPVSTQVAPGEFPDGVVDCTEFPADYGAVAVPWRPYGGWSGIQLPEKHAAGDKCDDGAYCSYACPPGYSKAQWPQAQPETGESLGGLLCKGGKLYRTHETNTGLCVKGHGGVYVKNELSKSVPICRTDYPGCENMVVPLFSKPGTKTELTAPDADTYYRWTEKKLPTSAQYYVNPQGTGLEKGCDWGTVEEGIGNWSPMIFGAGYNGGISWISISQNQLNSAPLNFNVRIEAIGDSKLEGECKYENGVFSGKASTPLGCTAALISGEAQFVLY